MTKPNLRAVADLPSGIRALINAARSYRDGRRAYSLGEESYELAEKIDAASSAIMLAAMTTEDRTVAPNAVQPPIMTGGTATFAIRYRVVLPKFPPNPEYAESWWQNEREHFLSELIANGESFLDETAKAIESGWRD